MSGRPIGKVLVANRGEIARRVLRAVRAMGLWSVAVYSDADAEAPHVREADEAVRIGPAPAAESYLDVERIVGAALRTGADAIHPGYGFLSENPALAERCAEAGITFIGPPAAAMRAMGLKARAKEIARAAGVPVLEGFPLAGMPEGEAAAAAARLGFPLLVKASAGGGGRGMRVVRTPSELAEALAAARREARSAFGDDALLLERLVENPRHVEVQILADTHGRVVSLFERECSVQRRYQKVIEEAPSPAVDPPLREALGQAAVRVAAAVGYTGAGTVEFLLGPDGGFHFLEMNTRLQVEHPVTEAITGLDLVQLQVRVAAGEALPLRQEDVRLRGHAIEARLYAEDPARDFLPATGTIALWAEPHGEGVRVDSGVEAGSVVGAHYDPLLAKVIAWGEEREQARRRLLAALERFAVAGVTTNRGFLLAVLRHPAFRDGDTDTAFIDRHVPAAARAPAPAAEVLRQHALVAVLFDHAGRRAGLAPLPPSIPLAWRNNPWRPQRHEVEVWGQRFEVSYDVRQDGTLAAAVRAGEEDGHRHEVRIAEYDGRRLALEIDGLRRSWLVGRDGQRRFVHGPDGTSTVLLLPRFGTVRSLQATGGCVAPMTGIVRRVCVSPGQRVTEGDVLLVLEAMKMEHPMRAHATGTVREVRVREGQMVDPDDVLVVIEPEE